MCTCSSFFFFFFFFFFSPWRKYCSLLDCVPAPWRGSLSSTHWLEGGEVSARGKASRNTPCHSGNQTAATKPARVSFSFLYFFSFFFFFSPQFFPFLSFSFCPFFLSFFFLLKFLFSTVGKRHTRDRKLYCKDSELC